MKIPSVPYAVQERLLEYYRDHFYLFDNQEIFEANQSESILKVFHTILNLNRNIESSVYR